MQSSRQYKRHAQVIIGKSGKGLLVENLRIVFEVVKDHQSAPNFANIKIYNLNDQHQNQIRTEYDDIILNAGYEGDEAVLFRGNIKHVYRYRDGNDWIVEIDAGDGDRDFRGAVVNETLATGASDTQLVDRVCSNFSSTKKGSVKGVGETRRLRGKVVSGNARDVLHDIARQHDCTWSIQDGRLQIVKSNGVLDTEAILVNGDTGMLGAPQQDDKGIKAKTLLNPLYQINGRVKLDNDNIKRKKKKIGSTAQGGEDVNGTTEKPKEPARLDPDGIYKIYKLTHKGDNRGQDWITEVECVSMDSAFPQKGAK